MASSVDLLARWSSTALALSPGATADAVRATGEELLARWGEPHRRHHDVVHLAEVLDAVDLLAEHARTPEAVRAAAWFHDVVYDGRPGDDERASAVLARAALTSLGAGDDVAAQVERLVLLTDGHDPADGDADGEVLCDADLAVLASGPVRYGQYARAVRAEYAHVPEEAFRAGRAAVLRGLLAHPVLFRTPAARSRWEAAARSNLEREVALLEG